MCITALQHWFTAYWQGFSQRGYGRVRRGSCGPAGLSGLGCPGLAISWVGTGMEFPGLPDSKVYFCPVKVYANWGGQMTLRYTMQGGLNSSRTGNTIRKVGGHPRLSVRDECWTTSLPRAAGFEGVLRVGAAPAAHPVIGRASCCACWVARPTPSSEACCRCVSQPVERGPRTALRYPTSLTCTPPPASSEACTSTHTAAGSTVHCLEVPIKQAAAATVFVRIPEGKPVFIKSPVRVCVRS